MEIPFDPPWTQDLMSEEAKLELGMLQTWLMKLSIATKSPLVTFDLEEYYPEGERILDLSHSLEDDLFYENNSCNIK